MESITRRTLWADLAKGVCIVLVVLWHVVTKHYLKIGWTIDAPVPGVWGTLGTALLPLRMPLFFAISGMFAVSAVNRPWPVLLRSRVARFGYLYLFWVLLHTTLLRAARPDFPTERAGDLWTLARQLTVSPTNLWYLLALATYFAVAKAVSRWPGPPVLAAAMLLSAVASAGLLSVEGNRLGMYQNLVFFLGGLQLRPALERLAEGTRPVVVAVAGTAYAGLLVIVHQVDGAIHWLGVRPLLSVIAVVLGVTTAALVAERVPAAARALASLGRRTLPIYVLHMPLLALADHLLRARVSRTGQTAQIVLAVVEPALLTAVLVLACLALHRLLVAAGAGPFFGAGLFPGPAPGSRTTRPMDDRPRVDA